jgi:hypothetical protein
MTPIIQLCQYKHLGEIIITNKGTTLKSPSRLSVESNVAIFILLIIVIAELTAKPCSGRD